MNLQFQRLVHKIMRLGCMSLNSQVLFQNMETGIRE